MAPYRPAASLLQTMIEDPETEASIMAQSIVALWRIPSGSTRTVLEGLQRLENMDAENYVATWTAVRDPKSVGQHRDELLQALAEDTPNTPRAFAMLLAIASTPEGKKPATVQVDEAIQKLWETPQGQRLWLEALRLAQDPKWETKIWQLTGSSDQDLAESAGQLAKQMKLQPLLPAEGPTIKELGIAAVMQQLGEPRGHEKRGQLWFAKLNCANCHTVSPGESPRGPYLPNVAKTYNRGQLAEAILEPSKTLAQGFVTETFALEDGNQVTGFVTEEAATRITLRDAEGREIILSPEEIEDRAKQSISVMPEGLVDHLGPQDLRDLLDYVQSLGKLAEENDKK
jgi:putative heme-binding domain-containing protein